jgi:hypothetical protein
LKVFELMASLADMPAGADVYVYYREGYEGDGAKLLGAREHEGDVELFAPTKPAESV